MGIEKDGGKERRRGNPFIVREARIVKELGQMIGGETGRKACKVGATEGFGGVKWEVLKQM